MPKRTPTLGELNFSVTPMPGKWIYGGALELMTSPPRGKDVNRVASTSMCQCVPGYVAGSQFLPTFMSINSSMLSDRHLQQLEFEHGSLSFSGCSYLTPRQLGIRHGTYPPPLRLH